MNTHEMQGKFLLDKVLKAFQIFKVKDAIQDKGNHKYFLEIDLSCLLTYACNQNVKIGTNWITM